MKADANKEIKKKKTYYVDLITINIILFMCIKYKLHLCFQIIKFMFDLNITLIVSMLAVILIDMPVSNLINMLLPGKATI
jgi:hypothetical protein